MTEPTIHFVSAVHRKNNVVAIKFDFSRRIYAMVCNFDATIYSKTLGCYYIIDDRAVLSKIYDSLKDAGCQINTSKVSRFIYITDHNLEVCATYKNYLSGLRYSESTIQTYLSFIKAYAEFMGERNIESSAAKDFRLFIEDKVAGRNFSISTHRQLVSALQHLSGLYPELNLEIEPLKRPKRDQFKPEVLGLEEVIRLLQVTHNLKHRFILAMLYSCGLRISELLNMKLNALDLERRQILVKHGKGRKDRYVSIAQHIEPLLENYLASYTPSGYLIKGDDDKPYSPSSVRAFLKKSCIKAGIYKRVTPHTLRHSYATHMLENGVGLRHIQELLGHSKPETTMLYTHVARKDLLKIENPLDVAVANFRIAKRDSKLRLS